VTTRPWWAAANVYQVYPRSFRDSNGDGEGDLAGVAEGLDYLVALGIDALWLSPFYPSPLNDGGYDVANPRDVDRRYGTVDDARELIAQARARGLRVIVDVVPNHTSSDRHWFVEALAGGPGSSARDRYHFRDGRGADGSQPPNNWLSIFGGPAWTRVTEPDGALGQWYLHLFDASQPDLNWEHPEVRADGLETLKFWLDQGVSGFRVDVAFALRKHPELPDVVDPQGLTDAIRLDLYDGSDQAKTRRSLIAGSPMFDRDDVVEIYHEWRALLDSYGDDRMAVAEAWLYPPERQRRYVDGTLSQVFNFDWLVVGWDADLMRATIDATFEALDPVGALPTWALSNHDTQRVPTRLGGLAKARALALVTHALPGSVYVFQGEELGLSDAEMPAHARRDPIFLRSSGAQLGRDGCRVPLPWSGIAPPYGFSSQDVGTWLPQPDDWGAFTVEAQGADTSSVLSQYRLTLAARKAFADHRALTWIEWPDLPRVLAFSRGDITVVANTSAEAVDIPLVGEVVAASALGVESGDYATRVPGDCAIWIRAHATNQ